LSLFGKTAKLLVSSMTKKQKTV